MSTAEALARTRQALSQDGVPDPAREAVKLVSLALLISQEELYRDEPVLDAAADEYLRELTERRCRREPFAYLAGHQEFCGLDFTVSPAVLVPRPETEGLVESALRHLPRRPGRIVDVGTGSGAIGLALAHQGPAEWKLEGVDCDFKALEVARHNRNRLGLKMKLYPSDLLAHVEPGLLGIVANLPYVGTTDDVDPEVRWEPSLAVYAGRDGAQLISRLLHQAPTKLDKDGKIGLEIGIGQEPLVRELMRKNGLTVEAVYPDLSGVIRIMWGGIRDD